MEASVLGAPGERVRTLGGCRHVGWSGYPAAEIPRRLLVVQSEEGEAVCVLICMSPLRPRRLPYRTDGGTALFVVGIDEPSSGLFPEQAACVTAFPLCVLGQRGDGVAPGRGRWSSWHRGPL